MTPIRILLADDHTLVRSGIRALLEYEPDLRVVAEAATGEEAVELAERLAPDVVLMDLSMPGAGGLDATRRIARGGSDARVLVVTMHRADERLVAAVEAGASGYVTKDSPDRELVDAVRTVARGEAFLYPSDARRLLESYRAPRCPSPLERLSAREVDVLARTAEGYTAAEIGERLGISPKTVDTYRQRAMDKLHLRHRSDIVRFALESRLLASPAA